MAMATPKVENNGVTITKLPPKYGKIILTLTNCLLPEEKLSPTPSQVDGLDREVEVDLRILGCELIQTAGILLKLPQVAMATGQVLFQRFYYSKSFVRHPMETTAMGCLCLASKIEEAPRRIRDVINVFHHIKQITSGKNISSMVLDQVYITLKTQVIKAERRVLKELGFCVHVKHPHKIIVMYLQVLGFEKHEALMQYSWNYMNDALRTDVFVRYHPETIACACIYLTARRLKICLPRSPAWYVIFGVNEQDIHEVSYAILRLYKRPKVNPDELERVVEELRGEYQETRQKARAAAGLGLVSGNNTPANNSNSPSSPTRVKLPEWNKNNHVVEKHHSKDEKRRSRSKSQSGSPPHRHRSKASKKHRRSTSSRSPSRSRSRDRRKKSTHKGRGRNSYSLSPPPSPPKNNRKSRDKARYRSRSRSHDRDRDRRDRSRSRSYDRVDRYKYHDKMKSSSKHRSSDDGHKRSKDIRR